MWKGGDCVFRGGRGSVPIVLARQAELLQRYWEWMQQFQAT